MRKDRIKPLSHWALLKGAWPHSKWATNLLKKRFQKELTGLSTGNFPKRFVYKFNSKFLWARAHYHFIISTLDQTPCNNPASVSTNPDNIQLFHLFSDLFIHKHVIYKIHVVGIFILLLSHFTTSFQRSLFSNFFFRELLLLSERKHFTVTSS